MQILITGGAGHIASIYRAYVGDRHHLRLLQHDFREPDAIRVTRALPGQIMPPVLRMPVDEAAGKTFFQVFYGLIALNRLHQTGRKFCPGARCIGGICGGHSHAHAALNKTFRLAK